MRRIMLSVQTVGEVERRSVERGHTKLDPIKANINIYRAKIESTKFVASPGL